MGQICRDFFVTYVLAVIGLIVFTLILEAMLGTDLGNAFNIIPQIVAALVAGQRHGKRTGIRPESRFSWRASFWMTMISFWFSIIVALGFVFYMGPGDAEPLFDFLEKQFAIVIAIFAAVIIVYVLITRYFFGLGAKQGAAISEQADAEIFR